MAGDPHLVTLNARRLAYGLAAGLGLVAAGIAGPLVLPSGVLALVMTSALALGGLAAGAAGWRRAALLQEAADKASGEIDTLSSRLIRLEARLAEIERGGAAAEADRRAATAELTGEIALLGGLVRDLAVGVGAQERALAALQEGARGPAPPQAAPPAPSVPAQEAPPARPAPRPSLVEPPAYPEPVASPSPGRDTGRDGALVAALRADRLEVHLQPVVALPQRKLRFYEATAHLRVADADLAGPAEIGAVLERLGATPELDARLVARAAAIARHLAARGSDAVVTCPLAPASLRAPGFLRALGRVLESHPDVLGRLVLSISQRCWRTLEAEAAGALAGLRGRGVAFALDRARDLRLDPLTLADRGVRYVKLPADLLLRPAGGLEPDFALADLSAVLARAGIRLVAEGVEREGDVPDLIELDVPLAQGAVFGPPRAVRPEVLGAPPAKPVQAAAAPAPQAPPAPAPAAPRPGIAILPAGAPREAERVPLRSLLRRAQ